MRTIEFRGKRADNGEWIEGCIGYGFTQKPEYIMPKMYFATRDFGEIDKGGNPIIEDEIALGGFIPIIPKTIGQLRYENKHGKYFDGDIYKCSGYGIDVVSEFCEITDRLMHGDTDDIGEIVGNIYDNPELIK